MLEANVKMLSADAEILGLDCDWVESSALKLLLAKRAASMDCELLPFRSWLMVFRLSGSPLTWQTGGRESLSARNDV